MGTRQAVKDVMDYIRVRTQEMDGRQYVEFLEQLEFEIETAMEISDWQAPDGDE